MTFLATKIWEDGGDTVVSDMDLVDADRARRERFLLCVVQVAMLLCEAQGTSQSL